MASLAANCFNILILLIKKALYIPFFVLSQDEHHLLNPEHIEDSTKNF